MAELTRTAPNPGAGLVAEGGRANAPEAPCDAEAVRARLAPASRMADEPAIRVACVGEPLHMSNPTVGTGPLGGIAVVPDVVDPTSVRTQRQLRVDGMPSDVALRPLGASRHLLRADGRDTRVVLEPMTTGSTGVPAREVLVDGFRFMVEVESERIAALRERATRGRASAAHAGPLQVKAIIPGKVVGISVKAGDAVTAGQQLLVVEAMKMQNELRAPRDGTIDRVGVVVGVNIEIGDLLVVIS